MAYTTIDNPELHFQCATWNGTGSALSVTLPGSEDMQPDMVIVKNRDLASDWRITDSVRGTSAHLVPNGTDAEDSSSTALTSFNTDGFSTGNEQSYSRSGDTHVGWCFKGGGSASNNTNGSITASVSANPTAGFSVVSWTSDGSDATIGHGLSSAPRFIFHKHITGTVQWNVFANVPNAGTGGYLRIDGTNAWGSNSGFFGTAPNATVFSPGSHSYMSGNSNTNIAYCFADVKGYCKVGHYKGNGDSSNGPFVYTGFKPAFLLIKEVDGSDVWVLYDNKRLGYNTANYTLEVDGNGAEGTASDRMHLLSNGFKITYNWTPTNTSGQTYLYVALAESPLVNSNGVPNNGR